MKANVLGCLCFMNYTYLPLMLLSPIFILVMQTVNDRIIADLGSEEDTNEQGLRFNLFDFILFFITML